MRNLSSALTMGLIIAATGGLVAAYAFAADTTSGANPSAAPAQAAQPAPANSDAGTTPGTTNASSGASNAGTSAAPMNQDDTKANNAAAPDPTKDTNSNATQERHGQSGQASTPDANDKAARAQQSSKKHMAMSRKHIESVQAALANSGQHVAIDGVWGPKTTAALKDFQKAHGLNATGRLDHATREALPKST